jgi:diaminopimelate epimerase
MSSPIPFHKMVASGNDFVVIDNRKQTVKDPLGLTRKLCALHTGVGADGILLVEKSRKADFKMRIINSDGSEAEACGNGFRCIALYAREKMGYPAQFQFESLSGLIQAKVAQNRVRVQLVQPSEVKLRGEIQVNGHRLHYSFLNTGVPHAVIFVNGLSKIDVAGLGRAIRYHEHFKPRGTNVNFVEVKSSREIHVRTYERGVENETLACGTGSTASAIASALLDYTKPPVKVKTSGGEILTVDFKRDGGIIRSVTLEGEAHFVFEGKFSNGVKK